MSADLPIGDVADDGRTSPTPASTDDWPRENQLWANFQDIGGADERADLFRLYQPLARRIALRQFRARAGEDVDLNDLLQFAHTGLLEAIDRFNPTLGVPFKFYGNRRILGAILDGMARMSELSAQIGSKSALRRERVRSLRSDAVEARGDDLNAAMAQLGAIAGELAIGFMLEDGGFLNDADTPTQDTPYDSLVWHQLERRLAEEIELLPERERTVLTYHYLGAVSFTRIAELLNLSAGRIAQIHKSGLGILRKRLLKVGITPMERLKW